SSCWALDLHAPESIEAHAAGPSDKEIGPHGAIVYYHFGPRGDKSGVKIAWYDGGLQPERPAALPNGESVPARGVLFVGAKGRRLCGGAGGNPRLPGTGNGTPPTPTLPRSNGHHRDWIDACKGGKPASSNFEYGARLTEIALLGVLSLRTGRRIRWNAA